MSTVNILPDSRTSVLRGAVQSVNGYHVPIFCPSCGAEGGFVPQENMTFAFWLCNPCFAAHGEMTNTMVMPDEVYWKEVEHAQLEKHGRALTAEETLIELSNPESLESLLARDRIHLTPHAG